MICRLCLQDSTNGFGFFDLEGLNNKSAQIISKYFWFEPKKDDNISNRICHLCWTIIKNFHDLYTLAQQVNSSWIPKLNSIKTDPILNTSCDSISNDFQESIEIKNENEINLTQSDFEMKNSENDNEQSFNLLLEGISYSNEDKSISKIEMNEKNNVIRNKRRERPIGIKSCKKKKKATRLTDSENESIKDNANQKRPKRTSAIRERLAEGDVIIANFTKIICNVCSIELPNFTSLKTHSTFVHKHKGFLTCCGKKYYKRSKLVEHIEKHINPDKYKCQLCSKISMTRWTLKMHMNNVHKLNKTGPLPYQCKDCGKSFRLKSVMLRHQLVHIPEEERKFKCTHCDRLYPSQGTLNHHVRAYHDKMYSGMCDICGKTYNNKQDVQRHRLEIHEGAERMKYKCKYCDLLFTSKYLCSRHKFEEHEHVNQTVEHKCKICNKTLANSKSLRSHITYAHTAKPKFTCNLCGKNFKRELVLKEHVAAHSGQPLYACPHCPKTFTHSSNMHHHRKRVHPIEFEEARQIKDKKESWCKFTALTI